MASRTVKGLAVQLAVMQLFTQGLLFHPRKVEAEENQAKEPEKSNAPGLDGDIIVSSWGDMYQLDNSNASWTDSVVLQPSK